MADIREIKGEPLMLDTISTEFSGVLAATPLEVILRGRQYAATVDEPIDCVVHVTRDLYFSAVTAWLATALQQTANPFAIARGSVARVA